MNNIRVMLIDDHDISLLVAQHVISVSRVDITTFLQPSGYSALEYLMKNKNIKSNLPTIIFLDLDMPVVNGKDFLTKYFEIKNQLSVLPSIYILSSFNDKDKFKTLIKEGYVSDYILKPLTYPFFQNILSKVGTGKE